MEYLRVPCCNPLHYYSKKRWLCVLWQTITTVGDPCASLGVRASWPVNVSHIFSALCPIFFILIDEPEGETFVCCSKTKFSKPYVYWCLKMSFLPSMSHVWIQSARGTGTASSGDVLVWCSHGGPSLFPHLQHSGLSLVAPCVVQHTKFIILNWRSLVLNSLLTVPQQRTIVCWSLVFFPKYINYRWKCF